MIAVLRAARLGWHGIDRRIAARASHGGRLPVFLHELFWFGAKQAWACLFGTLMLALLIATSNLGTFTRAWMYPAQHRAWHMVPPGKIGSWLLLMIISYVMVSALYRRGLPDAAGVQRG